MRRALPSPLPTPSSTTLMHPQPLRYSAFSYKLGHADVCTFIKECIAVGIRWRRLVLSGPAWMWRLHVRRRLNSVRAFAHGHGTHRLPIISLSAATRRILRVVARGPLSLTVMLSRRSGSRRARPVRVRRPVRRLRSDRELSGSAQPRSWPRCRLYAV